MVGIIRESHRLAPTIRDLSTTTPSRLGGPTASFAAARDSDRAIATFNFDRLTEENASPCLSPAQQDSFKTDFYRELTNIRTWSAQQGWLPTFSPVLQVFVSNDYRISKSLVPAWFGHAGHMEFPAWRAIAGEAAIAHELVHVFFPSGNRFLAEGMAVYLQAKVGGNPAFPNFGRDLHEVARDVLRDMVPQFQRGNLKTLARVKLVDLDRIATPSPLQLRVGRQLYDEDPFGQAHIYPIVGSFVAFLVETHGARKFRTFFMRTPLVPFECDAGPPDRWVDVYGFSLSDLEGQWKSMIAGRTAKISKRNLAKEKRYG